MSYGLLKFIQHILKISELKELNFWRACLAEVFASAIYIIIVCGATVRLPGEPVNSRLHIALTVGFTVSVLASAFWEISGGHFNPVITLALTLAGKVSVIRLLFYVAAQCGGSIAGASILYRFTPESARAAGNLGSLFIHDEITVSSAFLIEAILTYQLVFVTMSSTDPINNMSGFQPPLAIGLSVTIGLLMGIPFSGACLNPIRALGPAVVMNKLKDQWVYWAGPIIGGSLGVLTYKYIFKLRPVKALSIPSTQTTIQNEKQQIGLNNHIPDLEMMNGNY